MSCVYVYTYVCVQLVKTYRCYIKHYSIVFNRSQQHFILKVIACAQKQ